MKIIITILGIFFILTGISLLVDSRIFFDFMEINLENSSLYYGAIIGRIVFGIILILASTKSTFPMTIRILGYIVLIAAIGLIFIGQKGFQSLVISVLPVIKSYGQITGIFVIAFGSFLVYAFAKKK